MKYLSNWSNCYTIKRSLKISIYDFLDVLLSPNIFMVSSYLVTDNTRECLSVQNMGFCFPSLLSLSSTWCKFFINTFHSFIPVYILILSFACEHVTPRKYSIASKTEKGSSLCESSCCLCKTLQHIFYEM